MLLNTAIPVQEFRLIGVQANFNAISDLAGEAVMDEAERTGEWKKQIEQDK